MLTTPRSAGRRRARTPRLRLALAVAIALMQSPAPGAAQPAPVAQEGAALQLSDLRCSVPDSATLEAFALDAQQRAVGQALPEEFPPEALRQRLQGTVYVRLTYAANQDRPQVDVERSSGHAVLDDYAIALARRAAPQPPDALRCRSFDIAFPLRFRVGPPDPGR
jgi:protein TonB